MAMDDNDVCVDVTRALDNYCEDDDLVENACMAIDALASKRMTLYKFNPHALS